MNLFVAILIVVATVTVAITLMLLARRRAPDGSHFNDGDRAAGVFGVLATGFSVLLGFIEWGIRTIMVRRRARLVVAGARAQDGELGG